MLLQAPVALPGHQRVIWPVGGSSASSAVASTRTTAESLSLRAPAPLPLAAVSVISYRVSPEGSVPAGSTRRDEEVSGAATPVKQGLGSWVAGSVAVHAHENLREKRAGRA